MDVGKHLAVTRRSCRKQYLFSYGCPLKQAVDSLAPPESTAQSVHEGRRTLIHTRRDSTCGGSVAAEELDSGRRAKK